MKLRATIAALGASAAVLTGIAAPAMAAGPVTIPVKGRYIQQVVDTRINVPGVGAVRTYLVTPTTSGRSYWNADLAYAELIRAVPSTNKPGMYDQYACHTIGARDKATFNLEPSRPAVGFWGTLSASCNPLPFKGLG